jgi:hypothetical protein
MRPEYQTNQIVQLTKPHALKAFFLAVQSMGVNYTVLENATGVVVANALVL